jgi:hypothetical protein
MSPHKRQFPISASKKRLSQTAQPLLSSPNHQTQTNLLNRLAKPLRRPEAGIAHFSVPSRFE